MELPQASEIKNEDILQVHTISPFAAKKSATSDHIMHFMQNAAVVGNEDFITLDLWRQEKGWVFDELFLVKYTQGDKWLSTFLGFKLSGMRYCVPLTEDYNAMEPNYHIAYANPYWTVYKP